MFGRKRTNIPDIDYNPDTMRAVLKCSICNGEQVVGFKDKQTGKFMKIMLISNGMILMHLWKSMIYLLYQKNIKIERDKWWI